MLIISNIQNDREMSIAEVFCVPPMTPIAKSSGFTLIELMIVVAIIGILTAIALPSYQDYVIRAKIADATSELSTRRVQMEQYYQDNHTYAGTTASGCATATPSQYFSFSCNSTNTATAFTITATGTGSMSGFSYSINESNVKTSTITSPANVRWQHNSASCWVIRTGGAC